MRMNPFMAFRKPIGSLEPVGLSPAKKEPTIRSILSASATIAASTEPGSSSSTLRGR